MQAATRVPREPISLLPEEFLDRPIEDADRGPWSPGTGYEYRGDTDPRELFFGENGFARRARSWTGRPRFGDIIAVN